MNHCFMLSDSSVAVVYVHVPLPQYQTSTFRYVEKCKAFPPSIEHRNIIVFNGPTTDADRNFFAGLPNVEFLQRDNSGYDIGAFQYAARTVPADLMVFFGAAGYPRKAGWLERMVSAWQKHGNALYGSMGNTGDQRFNVYPHVRTTGFWLQPELLNEYPTQVTTPEQRYPFEHGPNCLTMWVHFKGLKTLIADWNTEYEWGQWNQIPNGFHQGDQSGLITGDRLTDPPYYG